MSTLSWQVNSFSIFASFFDVIAHNSPVSFKLIYFLLCIKGPNESPNFKTFVCTGENSPNFSCHFPNHKSVFLQILHHPSMSWKITPLYFFSSKNTYFAQKEPIKVKIFETFECSGQNLSNSLCQFWNNKSIPLQIFHHSSLSLHITPVWIFWLYIFYFEQKYPMKVSVLTLSIILMKIWQIPHVIFQTTGQFFFKFCMTLQCHEMYLLSTFLDQTLYNFHKRDQAKCKSFRIFSTRIKIY